MNWLKVSRSSVATTVATLNKSVLRTPSTLLTRMIRCKSSSTPKKFNDARQPSFCRLYPGPQRTCFDRDSVTIERGHKCHGRLIRSFLYNELWPREPSVCGLWMPLDSPYLDVLTNRYAYSGDRFIAYERLQRTGERKMVGFGVGYKTYPWMIEELEEWAHVTNSRPEKSRMYFCAHCLRSPDFFKKYNVDYIYEIEVLCVSQDAQNQGIASMLLKTLLAHAEDFRHPLVQVVAVSKYTAIICEKCGLKLDWNIDYTEFVDDFGQCVFFPRRPHQNVGIYTKYNNPKEGMTLPCKEPY